MDEGTTSTEQHARKSIIYSSKHATRKQCTVARQLAEAVPNFVTFWCIARISLASGEEGELGGSENIYGDVVSQASNRDRNYIASMLRF